LYFFPRPAWTAFLLFMLPTSLSFTRLLILVSWFFVTVPSASVTRLTRSQAYSTSSSMGSRESPFSRSVTSNQSDGTQESCESPDALDRHQTMEVSCWADAPLLDHASPPFFRWPLHNRTFHTVNWPPPSFTHAWSLTLSQVAWIYHSLPTHPFLYVPRTTSMPLW
jgi:hypothetical protein